MAILNDFMAELHQAEQKAEALRKQFDETVAAQAQASFEQIREILDTYMRFLSQAQRNTLLTMLQAKGREPAQKVSTRGAKPGTVVAPKYQLPTGETWAGRGQPHKAFSAWSNTAEGRAWRKANKDQKFPAYPYSATASATAPAKARKASKVTKAAKGVRKSANSPKRTAAKKARSS